MADIAAIRSALASRLSTLLGNNGQASAYWKANPTPPSLQVVGIASDYDHTFGRASDVLIATIEGLAGATTDQGAQETLDNWLDTTGNTSVKAAIETERPAQVTLGNIVSDCKVTEATRPRIVSVQTTGGASYDVWSVEFTVEIIT